MSQLFFLGLNEGIFEVQHECTDVVGVGWSFSFQITLFLLQYRLR
jgi:hypothetical protein